MPQEPLPPIDSDVPFWQGILCAAFILGVGIVVGLMFWMALQ